MWLLYKAELECSILSLGCSGFNCTVYHCTTDHVQVEDEEILIFEDLNNKIP